MEKSIKNHVDAQLAANSGKNLFFDGPDGSMAFIRQTADMIGQLRQIDVPTQQLLLDYTVERSLATFYRVNQYYQFPEASIQALRDLYQKLFEVLTREAGEGDLESIAQNHYHALKNWLKAANPFAEIMYGSMPDVVAEVPCSEYGPDTQIRLLGIDLALLTEPVLDIGCGQSGQLVGFLRQQGIQAHGIDRLPPESPFCQQADWLTFDYGVRQWGTVLSNLGFSNHFKHHHFRSDGAYILYARKYMAILQSLKVGGKFHYAPDLPFIEAFLPQEAFFVEKVAVTGYPDFQATAVIRL